MVKGLYTAYTGMIEEMRRMDVMTNNLANASTTGYKKEGTVNQSFDDQLALKIKDRSEVLRAKRLGDVNLGVKVGETYRDYSQGSFSVTDNPYDLALDGNGFFAIEFRNKNGETSIKYTRDGSFKVDPQGYLVTNSGEYVMGTNTQTGNSERIYVGTDLISISPDNSVMINGENKYKFNIVDFENYDNLTKYGNNLYKGEGGFNSNNYSIKQKYLEGSNVDSINEIAMMMETVNEFEANQKVIQTIDSILGQIASDIGRVK